MHRGSGHVDALRPYVLPAAAPRAVSQALHAQLSQLSERYEKLAAKQQQLDAAAQLSALRRAPLVGITAAALGKLSAVVNALECEVRTRALCNPSVRPSVRSSVRARACACIGRCLP